MSEPIHGYHVTILRGVWERITSYGVPRLHAGVWAALNCGLGLYLLTYKGLLWLAVPLLLWLVGHGALALLTQWNQAWSDMFWAQLNQRYKDHYDPS